MSFSPLAIIESETSHGVSWRQKAHVN